MLKQVVSSLVVTSTLMFLGTPAEAEWYYTALPENGYCSESRLDYYVNTYNQVVKTYDLTVKMINAAIASQQPIETLASYETMAAQAAQDMSELHLHISEEMRRCSDSDYKTSTDTDYKKQSS